MQILQRFKGVLCLAILTTSCAFSQANRFNRIQVVDYVRSYTNDTANVGGTSNRFRSYFGAVVDLKTAGASAAVYVRETGGSSRVTLTEVAGDGTITALDALAATYFSTTPTLTTLGSTFTDTGSVRPSTTSTYSLGTTVRRWSNFFTDNIRITTGMKWDNTPVAGYVLTSDATGNMSLQASNNLPVVDTQTITKNAVDNTKQMRFSNALQTTGTTRVLTNPDADITLAGINLSQIWTALQDFQSIQPSATSTYSLGGNVRRWTNFFTDKMVMTATAGNGMTSDFVPSADVNYNIGAAAYRFNLIYGRALVLKSSGSPAIFNINDSLGNLLFSQSDAGLAAGDFRIYDAGVEKFSVYSGTTNIKTTALNISGTVNLTGTIQPAVDNTYNYGAAAARGRFAYFRRFVGDEYQFGASLGITQAVVVGTCTMNFTVGGLTSTAGVC